MATSVLIGIYAALLVYRKEYLHSHPYDILAFILIVQSAYIIQYNSEYFVCTTLDQWPVKIFNYSIFNWGNLTDQQTYEGAGHLFCSNQLWTFLFDLIFYSFNFMLAHDLVKTVKNPFDSLDKRRNKIWTYSFCIIIFTCPYWIIMTLLSRIYRDQLGIPRCGDFRFNYVSKPFEAVILLIYFMYVVYALLYAAKALFRKGMNQEIRKLIIYRQMVYQMILAVTGLPRFILLFKEQLNFIGNISGYFGDFEDQSDRFLETYYDQKFSYRMIIFNQVTQILLQSRNILIVIWWCQFEVFRSYFFSDLTLLCCCFSKNRK